MVINELHALATLTSSKELQWALPQYWSTTLYPVYHKRKDHTVSSVSQEKRRPLWAVARCAITYKLPLQLKQSVETMKHTLVTI